MQSALWKTAALASVMGIAGFVLFEIHGRLPVQTSQSPDASKFIGLDESDEGKGQQVTDNPGVELGVAGGSELPPFDQNEPDAGHGDGRSRSLSIAGAGSLDTGSPLREADHSAAAGGPPEDSYNPFAGSSLPAEQVATVADQPLVTADVSLPEQSENVEQVSASQGPEAAEANPFSTFDWPTDSAAAPVETAEAGSLNPFESQSEPAAPAAGTADVQLEIAAAGPGLSSAPEQGPLPGLTFANDAASGTNGLSEPYDPTTVDPNEPYDPRLVDPQAESAGDPSQTTLTAESPAGQLESQPAPSEEAIPVFDFGPALEEVPAVENDRSPSGLQSEPAPGLDFGSEPGSVEPSRLPDNVIDDDGPPARSALRARDFAPLQPAQNLEQPPADQPQIIPNPLRSSEPAAPSRSDFVGDATVDGSTAAGPQQPELTIQKVAPPDATVGDPLVYAIKVKNIGTSTAHDVIVEDRIPRGTTLEGSIPQAELTDRKLIWQLGHMEPGDEKTIRIKVVPTEAGEIGSVATVRFVAQVAATTRITTPSLTMDLQGPGEVAVGEQAVFKFKVANIGEGEARNVYVRNLLPPGFEHPGGRDIEYDVGSLRPGESRDIELSVRAATEGLQTLTAQLNTGTTMRAESQSPVKVIASRLLIQRTGPKHRFVGRPADYTTTVTNRSSNA
ncbi:MAG: DUF11 domain-containing protein, partial [Planctomycetaceae bacterium]|nr:DUF11 domain-containing protein [Planctomycetaceae bacterium]